MFKGARILVAPLNWGLGHAARVVPIIQRLLELDARPVIGADGRPLELLREEFPELDHVKIPGVQVRYSKGRSQGWSMIRQLPKLLASIATERGQLEKIRGSLALDAVISDQRFGLRSPDIPSVIITHQVFPFTPFAQELLRRMNLNRLGHFDRCWIMDHAKAPGLAGDLSHGRAIPTNARYIGTMSRMTIQEAGTKYCIVAVLSGPEPQRTLLEEILLEQMQRINGNHLLVSGRPGGQAERLEANINIVSHMATHAMAEAMCSAELIVSRSGYTTLMDLEAIYRSALLIPTPGQLEQEYLGALHGRTGKHLVQPQYRIDLHAALAHPSFARKAAVKNDRRPLEQALHDLATLIHG